MKILYYEHAIGRKTPEYFRYVRNPYLKNDHGPLRLGYIATRIWEWNSESNSVRCIKNRYTDADENTEVDSKEFLMIQLVAKEYRRETA